MTITGPGIPDSTCAQAFLADMANRLPDAPAGVNAALDRLADLPTTQGWYPERRDELAAVGEVYARGTLACALVVDRACDRVEHAPYTTNGRRPVFLKEEPQLGLLLRVADTLTAAGVVHGVLVERGWFGEHRSGHAQAMLALGENARSVLETRLAEQRRNLT
jgi:hypothetical protein